MYQQTTLALKVAAPYSFRYFVPHSGIAEAYHHVQRLLEQLIQLDEKREVGPEILATETRFSMTYIHGPESSGKQHLLGGFREQLVEFGIDPQLYYLTSLPADAVEYERWESEFVAQYETIRARGGVVIVTGTEMPDAVQLSPHTRSRLLAGSVIGISMPRDSELRPVIQSLLERHNLRLSNYSIDFLIRRLPRDLLSFDQIFDKIDELSLSNHRPATLGTIRQALESTSYEEAKN